METHPLNARHWHIVALIALGLGLLFVSPFLSIIALSALMAFLFNDIFSGLNKKMKAGFAAVLTFVISLLIVLVPVLLIVIFTAFQLGGLVEVITNAFGGDFSSIPVALQGFIESINSLASSVTGGEAFITNEGVSEFVRTTLPVVLTNLTGIITGFVGGIPFAIILSIMYIFLFFEFLLYGKRIISSIVVLSPFHPDVTKMYLTRIGLMANAMAKGQLVMSLIIAVLEALTLAFFFDFWQFFFLMTVVFTVFNLIPLGAGIVIYPMIFIMMLLGNIWPGVGALVLITAVSNLEAFLRPRFIPKSITLTNGLTMLAAFGGIALYGLLGVVYGPIIMIVIVTTVQMYLDYYHDHPHAKKPNTFKSA